MEKVKITFSNNDTLILKEGDFITPIKSCLSGDEQIASMSKHSILENHVHNGLVPSMMDSLCFCNFFYINDQFEITYGTNTIVKIEIL